MSLMPCTLNASERSEGKSLFFIYSFFHYNVILHKRGHESVGTGLEHNLDDKLYSDLPFAYLSHVRGGESVGLGEAFN